MTNVENALLRQMQKMAASLGAMQGALHDLGPEQLHDHGVGIPGQILRLQLLLLLFHRETGKRPAPADAEDGGKPGRHAGRGEQGQRQSGRSQLPGDDAALKAVLQEGQLRFPGIVLVQGVNGLRQFSHGPHGGLLGGIVVLLGAQALQDGVGGVSESEAAVRNVRRDLRRSCPGHQFCGL